MKLPQPFEDAILDFVEKLSAAESECATRLAQMSEGDWQTARQTIQSWLDQPKDKVINWRNILEMTEAQRS
jgi:hypothetical protein